MLIAAVASAGLSIVRTASVSLLLSRCDCLQQSFSAHNSMCTPLLRSAGCWRIASPACVPDMNARLCMQVPVGKLRHGKGTDTIPGGVVSAAHLPAH